jgi:hypothetical protein
MKICVYGNCQAGVVKDLLEFFSGEHISYIGDGNLDIHHITTWENIHLNREMDYDWVNKNCDIFLYQPIKDSRGVHSTNYILPKLKDSIKKIGIPFVYSNWLWPISMNPNNDKNGFNNNYTDVNIDCEFSGIDFLKQFHSPQEAEHAFFNGDIDFNLVDRMKSNLKSIRNQERSTDIKISDFIEENFFKELLFYRDVHPSIFLLKEICRRVLSFLGLPYDLSLAKKNLDLNLFPAVTGGYQPLSPHSFSELNLNFSLPVFFQEENENWKAHYSNLISNFFSVMPHLK